VDDRQGWLSTGGSLETQCNAEHRAIWHTGDGGHTWQLLNAAGIADSQCKRGLSFSDATRGFLAAWDQNHAPVIYWTADAGRTWTVSKPLPDPPGFTTGAGGFTLRPGRVHSFGSALLVAASGISSVVRQQHNYVFRSTDSGRTWTYLATAPNSGDPIALTTASRWLQLSLPGQTAETLDAGATWHCYATNYWQAAPVAPDVFFADPVVGYVTVRGGLKRTLDGGAIWTRLRTPGTASAPEPTDSEKRVFCVL
jgi:photosystem II stability/assembly factor-like uncharacterized protein